MYNACDLLNESPTKRALRLLPQRSRLRTTFHRAGAMAKRKTTPPKSPARKRTKSSSVVGTKRQSSELGTCAPKRAKIAMLDKRGRSPSRPGESKKSRRARKNRERKKLKRDCETEQQRASRLSRMSRDSAAAWPRKQTRNGQVASHE